jgi:hypothetical protein
MNKKQMSRKAKAERKSPLRIQAALEKGTGARKDEPHRAVDLEKR